MKQSSEPQVNKQSYDGEKENLPKKFGDFFFNIATALFIGLLLDVVFGDRNAHSIFAYVLGGAFFVFFFIVGTLMYQRGGLK